MKHTEPYATSPFGTDPIHGTGAGMPVDDDDDVFAHSSAVDDQSTGSAIPRGDDANDQRARGIESNRIGGECDRAEWICASVARWCGPSGVSVRRLRQQQ